MISYIIYYGCSVSIVYRVNGRCVFKVFYDRFLNFIDFFKQQISDFGINDLLDILIVALLMYYVMKFVLERRAGKLALGIVFLLILEVIAEIFNFDALLFIMGLVFQVGIIAVVIVFQPELRSGLEKMGGESLKGLKNIGKADNSNDATAAFIDKLCEALLDLSRDKTGALVVIERTTKLGDVIKSGVVINADMSPHLMRNIFFNKAPLHDGAVVIRANRICAAGCFLPLSTNSDIIKDLGTRHRAAIGMSENSDAIVLVVSEETGNVSMAAEGNLTRGYNYMTLRRELRDILLKKEEGKIRKNFRLIRSLGKKDNAGKDDASDEK